MKAKGYGYLLQKDPQALWAPCPLPDYEMNTSSQEWVATLMAALESQTVRGGSQGQTSGHDRPNDSPLTPEHIEQLRMINTLSMMSGLPPKELVPAIKIVYLDKCKWSDQGTFKPPCGATINPASASGLSHLGGHRYNLQEASIQCKWVQGRRICGLYASGEMLHAHLLTHMESTRVECKLCHHREVTPRLIIRRHLPQCPSLAEAIANKQRQTHERK